MLSIGSANITIPTIQSPDLVQRGTIAGGPSVILKCDSTGTPGPSLRWFYNGGPISGSSGVSENGAQVTIPTPQVDNSGIYQCFVSNGVEGALENRQRTWIVEVTTPSRWRDAKIHIIHMHMDINSYPKKQVINEETQGYQEYLMSCVHVSVQHGIKFVHW